MFEGLGGWVEDIYTTGKGLLVQTITGKRQAEIEKKRFETQVQIERERTKKILYFGVGMIGVVLMVRMAKLI